MKIPNNQKIHINKKSYTRKNIEFQLFIMIVDVPSKEVNCSSIVHIGYRKLIINYNVAYKNGNYILRYNI